MSAPDAPDRPVLTARILSLLARAEESISRTLLSLEQETGFSIDDVDVDTRNFGRLRIEVRLTKRVRQ